MSDITIRKIPSCIVYTAEYDVPGVDSFFDEETGDNALYDLQYLMTGLLNQHPRTAIAFTKEGRDDYAEFYKEIVTMD